MSIDTKDPLQKTVPPRSKSLMFADYIINRCRADNGLRAALKRADNPATEYQSWEVLAGFHINLEYENQRLPHAAIAAAIARSKIDENGTAKIGQAIARCYEDGNASDQAKARLRRLLACDSVPEACRILRPLFSLIESKGSVVLDYASLLNDLLRFGHEDSRAHIKARWAQDFYGKPAEGGKDD
ncbi:type I-E CRISPR-associated protein Cse2/CasB [Nitrosovibrio tenuis]|uniref:CRISPR-associated protein, Cse2 family n=1 Tax=Nitrosovibrio tenuis TaxID=1233 RepID=A0A1H7KH74_9PROT|nr:type I-E CRISPR-associated protein Cse2/CasB [Nitrosovibrio tenuis]SEK86158.1 CRISPR-associated protein, Cse2 family [Nitrosovibrio tenuis]